MWRIAAAIPSRLSPPPATPWWTRFLWGQTQAGSRSRRMEPTSTCGFECGGPHLLQSLRDRHGHRHRGGYVSGRNFSYWHRHHTGWGPRLCCEWSKAASLVIDIATNTVVGTISGLSGPVAVAITPDGTHAYTLNVDPTPRPVTDVSVIDTASNMVVGSPIPIGPASLIGVFAISRHPGWDSRLCREWWCQFGLGDLHRQQHRDGFGYGGDCPFRSSLRACLCSFFGKGVQWYLQRDLQRQYDSIGGPELQVRRSGGVTGNVFVTGGNFAFANGLIGGSVGIAGASTFSLGPATTIDGSLGIGLIAPRLTTDQVCGVNVRHDFAVVGDASPLQIGSASPASCAGNTVGGNATIDVNSGAIAVYDNSVTRTLSCLANKSITGQGNTAKSKLGQCKPF